MFFTLSIGMASITCPSFPFSSSGGKQGIDDGFLCGFDGSHKQGRNIFIVQHGDRLYGAGWCVGTRTESAVEKAIT